jgi:hypothetical protein
MSPYRNNMKKMLMLGPAEIHKIVQDHVWNWEKIRIPSEVSWDIAE